MPTSRKIRRNVSVFEGASDVNLPVDCLIMPFGSCKSAVPIFLEAKSAGDETNTNKRRKEEALKARQLRDRFGKNVKFVLFLCGYFNYDYLGFEAAYGIDWVWEHRIDDLAAIVPAKKCNGGI